MARSKERGGFRSGFQHRMALVQLRTEEFVGWRLWSPRMGFLGQTILPWSRISGFAGKRLVK